VVHGASPAFAHAVPLCRFSIALLDGSSIDGETTYTTSSGTSGTAATVTLASDPNGYVATAPVTSNTDGSETIANTAANPDGSTAFQRILNTAISSGTLAGLATTTTSRTLSTVNNGGAVLTLRTAGRPRSGRRLRGCERFAARFENSLSPQKNFPVAGSPIPCPRNTGNLPQTTAAVA
jgi:hypothetical protein